MNDSNDIAFSRRNFGKFALASAAVAAITPAFATKPTPINTANPKGIFTTKIGEYSVTALLDGTLQMKPAFFSGPDEQIKTVLEQTGQTGETIPSPISAFLLQTKEKNILIDSGVGSLPMFGPGLGNLLDSLLLLGITPNKIDTVIVTHAHPDHIGGLLSADNKIVFPNAELILAEKEVKFWTDQAMMAKAPKMMQGAFKLAQKTISAYQKQITLVQTAKEVLPGITTQIAAGHTPGHSLLRMAHGATEVVMVADSMHNVEVHTAVPDAQFGFDVDSQQAIATRKKLFDQLSADKALIFGSHIPFSTFGRILKLKESYRYSPAVM